MSTESGVLSFDEVEVELREKPSNVRSVNVMICSWNVGNAPPILEEMKAHWITPGRGSQTSPFAKMIHKQTALRSIDM